MRRTVLALVVAVGLAGCSSSKPAATSLGASSSAVVPATSLATSATPPAAPTTSQPAAAPSTSNTCNLPDRGDIIEWQKLPNLPDSAIELGGTDPEHCTWTFDSLKASSPAGAGYCTEAAWASDNPNYDTSATPAPSLKKVQVTIGDCG